MTDSPSQYFAMLSTSDVELQPRDEAEVTEWGIDSTRVKRWFDLSEEVSKLSALCDKAEEVTGSVEKAEQVGTLLGLSEKLEELNQLEEDLNGAEQPIIRSVMDWSFVTYPSDAAEPKTYKLESGLLVKVFNTVSDADTVLKLENIKLKNNGSHRSYPEGFTFDKWYGLCSQGLPAKLTKVDGSVVYGVLNAITEQGSEGPFWIISDYSKTGYEAWNSIGNGDTLEIFENVRDGNIAWEGVVAFGPENPQNLDGTEILREPQHMSLEGWRTLSWGRHPAVITSQPQA